MLNEFTIIFERGENGWWISTIPEVPGALSQGRTKDEARQNALDPLTELMAARRELALRQRAADSEIETIRIAR
jgi:predicted RNase H-like HicB family nuclease